jgi:hypothetical protein
VLFLCILIRNYQVIFALFVSGRFSAGRRRKDFASTQKGIGSGLMATFSNWIP